MAYKYISENNLYHKQTYMYSEYDGICFLKEYIASREKYLNKCEFLKEQTKKEYEKNEKRNRKKVMLLEQQVELLEQQLQVEKRKNKEQ